MLAAEIGSSESLATYIVDPGPKPLSKIDLDLITSTVNSEIKNHNQPDPNNANAENSVTSVNFIQGKHIGNEVSLFLRSVSNIKTGNYFMSLQKWICYITEVHENSFEAKLEDLVNPGTYEIGEFDKKEVSFGDLELFKVGATFYWSIGYSMKGSQIEKNSVLRFQRIVNWSEDEYNTAIDNAKGMYEYFAKEL